MCGLRRGPDWRRRRRRRLYKRDFYQPLDRVRGARELNAKASQDNETQDQLNEYDRGERVSALPRPHHSFMLCISGHRSARLTPQR